MNTPGTISELGDMRDAHAHYDLASDTTVFRRGQHALVTISALPRIDLTAVMQDVLAAYDPNRLASAVQEGELAGRKAVSVEIDQEDGNMWAAAVRTHDLTLLIFARDSADAAAHQPMIEDMLETVQFAPAMFPEPLVGSFRMQPASTSLPATDAEGSFGAVSAIKTHSDGTFTIAEHSSAIGMELIFDNTADKRGRWEVRGNRLLSFVPPARFSNFLLDMDSDGLLLRDARGEQIHLARDIAPAAH